MKNPRVLIVATSQNIDLSCSTAAWLEELAQPYFAFRDFTHDIVIASVNGITISIRGAAKEKAGFKRCSDLVKQEDVALAWIASAVPLHEIDPDDFDLLYIAGSDRCMQEMDHCVPLTAILEAFIRDNKPVAAIGLGVTPLTSIFLPENIPFVQGRKMTAFSNKEVVQQNLNAWMPFSLESRLLALGAAFSSKPFNRCNVLTDGMLVTGQNASASTMAVLALRRLSTKMIAQS